MSVLMVANKILYLVHVCWMVCNVNDVHVQVQLPLTRHVLGTQWNGNFFCTHTGTTNNLLTGDIIYQNSPNDATIICVFLSGFNGSARCTVQYGTDPSYSNLPYSAESTETGTAGDILTVVLREQLNSSAVYYYTVSAVSGDVTVTVRRTFTTPQYGKYICMYVCMYAHFQPSQIVKETIIYLLPFYMCGQITCTDSFCYTKIGFDLHIILKW